MTPLNTRPRAVCAPFYHLSLERCCQMLSAVSCWLSVCVSGKLKMTLVLIGAISAVYPGLYQNSQPPI